MSLFVCMRLDFDMLCMYEMCACIICVFVRSVCMYVMCVRMHVDYVRYVGVLCMYVWRVFM